MLVCVLVWLCFVCPCELSFHARAQQLDCKQRIAEWKIAEEMVELILNKVTETESSCSGQGNSPAAVNIPAVRGQGGSVITFDDLAPVSDAAREEDKKIRLTILQKLLELACAMVVDTVNLFIYMVHAIYKLTCGLDAIIKSIAFTCMYVHCVVF